MVDNRTELQKAVYDFCCSYIEHYQTFPPFRVIAQRFDWSSVNAVSQHIAALVRKGWIEKRWVDGVNRYRVPALNVSRDEEWQP